tara:strand:+ start:347 stop:1051 length:705 start_codon:yes stop_codon:yes gene_type:complete
LSTVKIKWAIFVFFLLSSLCCQKANNHINPRLLMVQDQIIKRGIEDQRVLDVMKVVERHKFVPERYSESAYKDGPLPIGYGQTISQPFIVAFMTENLKLKSSHKVLEIGTGSGYQAAVLSELCDHVYTIEIVDALANESTERLEKLGYKNITVRSGDGYKGWPEEAPFDRIMVTAAPEEIPELLIEQLAEGGIMVIPVGKQYEIQYLWVITKEVGGQIKKEKILPVRFVPMVTK